MQIYLCRQSKQRTWRFPGDAREGRSLSLVLACTLPRLNHSLTVYWGFAYPALPGVLIHNAPSHSHWENHLACCGKRVVLTGKHHFWIYVKVSEARESEGDVSFTLIRTPCSPGQVRGEGRRFRLATGVPHYCTFSERREITVCFR